MKIEYFLLALLVVILQGCAKQDIMVNAVDETPGTIYLIKKGNHFAEGNNLNLVDSQHINCTVIFDGSAVYESMSMANQLDVNKLIGFSDCNTFHHENSARIGWSWNGMAVQLYAYVYINNERMIMPLSAVALHQPIQCSVKAIGDKYYFKTGTYIDSMPRHCAGYTGSAYKLYPYFGGDEAAPHDVTISIKEF